MELKDWFLLEQTQVIPVLYNKKPVFIVVGGTKGVDDNDKVYSILLRYENGKYGFSAPYDVLKGKWVIHFSSTFFVLKTRHHKQKKTRP